MVVTSPFENNKENYITRHNECVIVLVFTIVLIINLVKPSEIVIIVIGWILIVFIAAALCYLRFTTIPGVLKEFWKSLTGSKKDTA